MAPTAPGRPLWRSSEGLTRDAAPDSSEERVHRAERRYGHFRRSITLPTHVNSDAIEASTQDGVLQIMVPKAEEVHAKRIQVRVGGVPTLPTARDEGETNRQQVNDGRRPVWLQHAGVA